uniref:Metallothionein n=1 Tax=Cacopsylla melanoneura TaxID=428564 RepID=A0A8D8ZN19_9HEMI
MKEYGNLMRTNKSETAAVVFPELTANCHFGVKGLKKPFRNLEEVTPIWTIVGSDCHLGLETVSRMPDPCCGSTCTKATGEEKESGKGGCANCSCGPNCKCCTDGKCCKDGNKK